MKVLLNAMQLRSTSLAKKTAISQYDQNEATSDFILYPTERQGQEVL